MTQKFVKFRRLIGYRLNHQVSDWFTSFLTLTERSNIDIFNWTNQIPTDEVVNQQSNRKIRETFWHNFFLNTYYGLFESYSQNPSNNCNIYARKGIWIDLPITYFWKTFISHRADSTIKLSHRGVWRVGCLTPIWDICPWLRIDNSTGLSYSNMGEM